MPFTTGQATYRDFDPESPLRKRGLYVRVVLPDSSGASLYALIDNEIPYCIFNFREEGISMPYANNHSVRIHYQVEGEGPPLVLQHGFTSSLQNWYAYGYVAALRQDYQLILIDARGHGQSDKLYDPQAYALRHRVEDVLAVLDALQVDNAHYLGYSMGGRIGFGIANRLAEAGARVVILNEQATPFDKIADAKLRGSISEVLPQICSPKLM